MAGFGDLGIRNELIEAAEALGLRTPTPVQRASIPVLRRGGNVVVNASAGAGVTAAYGLALLDRIAGEEERGAPSALVLVPTDHLMGRKAELLARLGRATGLSVRALEAGWAPPEGADVVVATAGAALEAISASRIKLDGLRAIVLDGAGAIFDLAGAEAIETIVGILPREAQRVVVSGEEHPAVEGFVERHVRRAMTLPPRPAAEVEPAPATGTVGYVVVGEARKTTALARWLADRPAGDVAVVCRSEERAREVERDLSLRGLTGENGASVFVAGQDLPADAVVVSYDVPFEAEALRGRHDRGGLVMIEPGELAHLRRIAADAALALKGQDVLGAAATAEIESYRERLLQAIRQEDLSAQLLLLEPLLEEFSGAEVAAAASALLRRRAPEPVAPAPQRRVVAAAAAPSAPAGPAPQTYTRLFVSVGERDGVRPGDLVGSITGEANITGDQIGRIEIRDTFSIVEVSSGVAERVIRALNGITLKGRSVRADYDRKPTGGGPGGARRGPGGPRRGPGAGPGGGARRAPGRGPAR